MAKKVYFDEMIEEAMAKGDTVTSIAGKLGISPSLVSRYRLRKKGSISALFKARVAKAFKVRPDQILIRSVSSSGIKNARDLFNFVDKQPHCIVKGFFAIWERRYREKK